ncbi:hypothetical protein DYB28_006131, partial [Aphanomyces astaci]
MYARGCLDTPMFFVWASPCVLSVFMLDEPKKIYSNETDDDIWLMRVGAYGMEALVVKLIKASADVHVTNDVHWSPLHEACHRGYTSIVKELLRAGTDGTNAIHWTALHEAAYHNRSDVVRMLVVYGADVLIKTHRGAKASDLTISSEIKTMLDDMASHANDDDKASRTQVPTNNNNHAVNSNPGDSNSPPKAKCGSPGKIKGDSSTSPSRSSEADGGGGVKVGPLSRKEDFALLGDLPALQRLHVPAEADQVKDGGKAHKPKKSSKRKQSKEEAVPAEFKCAITHKLLVDPVKSPYGHVFERSVIEKWIQDYGHRCPISGEPLGLAQLTPQVQLKDDIASWNAPALVMGTAIPKKDAQAKAEGASRMNSDAKGDDDVKGNGGDENTPALDDDDLYAEDNQGEQHLHAGSSVCAAVEACLSHGLKRVSSTETVSLWGLLQWTNMSQLERYHVWKQRQEHVHAKEQSKDWYLDMFKEELQQISSLKVHTSSTIDNQTEDSVNPLTPGLNASIRIVNSLLHVTTPQGRVRAWIRHCCNTHLLSSCLAAVMHPHNQAALSTYFAPGALCCDVDMREIFVGLTDDHVVAKNSVAETLSQIPTHGIARVTPTPSTDPNANLRLLNHVLDTTTQALHHLLRDTPPTVLSPRALDEHDDGRRPLGPCDALFGVEMAALMTSAATCDVAPFDCRMGVPNLVEGCCRLIDAAAATCTP